MTELSKLSNDFLQLFMESRFYKNPYMIPTYEDIQDFNNLYQSGIGTDKEQFECIVQLVRLFPELHSYIVEKSGKPRFPDFNLPSSFAADIVRYIGSLLKKKKYIELEYLFQYFEDRYLKGNSGERIVFGDFVLSYLYLLDDEEGGIEKKLPTNLLKTYCSYFK